MTKNAAQRRPIRVAVFNQSGDLAGGSEKSLALLLAHMPASVHVEVVLFSDGAYADSLRKNGQSVTIINISKSVLSIQREKLPLSSAVPAVSAVLQIRNVLRQLEIDVAYTNSVKAHFLAGIAARTLGIPTIAHLRDILVGNARQLLRMVLLTCTTHRIAISRAVARAYRLSNMTVVMNPLDLRAYENPPDRNNARKHLGLPLNVPVVGVIGRINRWKGQDVFLHIARIVANVSEAHFAIVGAAVFRDDDFVDELHALAKSLGLEGRVHFIPWLADPREAFVTLDVNCNTSKREPFGRTIIEAAALGVPSVSFDDGGAEDAISPNLAHDLIRSGDTAGFAHALERYIKNPDLLHAAGVEAKSFSETFDATHHADIIGDLIARVASKKR